VASIYLQDSDGLLWQLQIVVTGGTPAWQSTQVAGQYPQTIILEADASHVFQLTVDTSGTIGTAPSQDQGQTSYMLGASDCTTGWLITVDDSGAILLTQVIPWNPGPVVGQLFPTDDTNGPWSQPGGIGTKVFPEQQIGEKIGLFTAFCEHWFNSWLIQQTSVCGVPSAIVCANLLARVCVHSWLDFV
jgi:hypothetical protein